MCRHVDVSWLARPATCLEQLSRSDVAGAESRDDVVEPGLARVAGDLAVRARLRRGTNFHIHRAEALTQVRHRRTTTHGSGHRALLWKRSVLHVPTRGSLGRQPSIP